MTPHSYFTFSFILTKTVISNVTHSLDEGVQQVISSYLWTTNKFSFMRGVCDRDTVRRLG